VIRVAFAPPLDGTWLGGINYFRNLIGALASLDAPGYEFILFSAPTDDCTWVPRWRGLRLIRADRMQRNSGIGVVRRVTNRFLRYDAMLESLLVSHNVDLLSHSGHLGGSSRIATLSWFPDLQHRALPELFSARELLERDKMVKDYLRFSDLLLLSSASARDDLERCFPGALKKASVLHFVADTTAVKSLPASEAIRAKYAVPERYFHLPNQFWAHKNHAAAIQAVRKLKEQGRPVTVICNGSPSDYRQPGYFETLMRSANGLDSVIRVLGVIPYEDMLALMRDSVAVINPSLFEGWSTTVEEAKSMGKCVLLSDIPVHREQAPERGVFFDPHRPDQLAEAMVQAMGDFDAAREIIAQERAAAALPERRKRFATLYLEAVHEALNRKLQ
jgi:glycosyltransferase involved in cell wall biosynthesis